MSHGQERRCYAALNNFIANCLDLGRRNEALVSSNNGFISVIHEYAACNPWDYEGTSFLLTATRFFQIFDRSDCYCDGQIYMARKYGVVWRTVVVDESVGKEDENG